MLQIDLQAGEKIYFASDLHLGFPNEEESLIREKNFITWLDHIQKDAAHIFLLGDIFDFWFEYKYVIPRGFIRFQGKLAELVDKGIAISLFTGNHDMWMFGYFTQELGIPVYYNPLELNCNNLKMLIGHGDGLGPGDYSYKVLKKVFRNPVCQWLFGVLNPNIGMWLAHTWSKGKKHKKMDKGLKFFGEEEYIFQYCKAYENKQHCDYYLFGHRHIPSELQISEKSKYINIGDWIANTTYAVFDGEKIVLETW
ncbi:MAG: UDP-2,3-diacylglucosamine diphosphatase [Bacteroidota bacterium]